ncbi:hypothetical protein BCR32DRAFT_295128 [Anaeromyces robustus]|uniref:MATH domain-containing protein n=1 Tax=Anaeromyces robustus TaxID=1754192 RepID=A0A1Y1WYL1_9FUNG|nr:hypothetical protein BCR32DRAFT_295128 [Anaeromyces robustus]|eukprot:ORX78276.1 hypothetical protein BCR32DRAFT_295128 [Anaeromyces robustus]
MNLFFSPNNDKIKNEHVNILKDLIDDNGLKVVEDRYFEWKIKDWSDFINIYDKRMYSLPFTFFGHTWMIKLKSPLNEYHREEKYLRICLANKTNDNKERHILVKFLFSFRDPHDYSLFKSLPSSSFFCISNVTTEEISSEYAYSEIVNEENFHKYIQPLIKDDTLILCMNLRIYNNTILGKYLDKLKKLINDNDKEIADEDYYEWKVDDLDVHDTLEFSPNFLIGGYKWGINLSSVKKKEYLELIFRNTNPVDSLKKNKDIYVNCVLSIRNRNDFSFYHAESSSLQCFNKTNRSYTFSKFYKISDLFLKNEISKKPLFEDRNIIIGAYVRIYKNKK